MAGELEIHRESHCVPFPNVTLKYVLSTTGHPATVEFFISGIHSRVISSEINHCTKVPSVD